jgi:hypothetical protein
MKAMWLALAQRMVVVTSLSHSLVGIVELGDSLDLLSATDRITYKRAKKMGRLLCEPCRSY